MGAMVLPPLESSAIARSRRVGDHPVPTRSEIDPRWHGPRLPRWHGGDLRPDTSAATSRYAEDQGFDGSRLRRRQVPVARVTAAWIFLRHPRDAAASRCVPPVRS